MGSRSPCSALRRHSRRMSLTDGERGRGRHAAQDTGSTSPLAEAEDDGRDDRRHRLPRCSSERGQAPRSATTRSSNRSPPKTSASCRTHRSRESIARLPGLTSQRLAGSGRSNYISIRGFGPDFSTTTAQRPRADLDRRQSRNVEYDQYPSEIISSVNIYKTPKASLDRPGPVRHRRLRTIRPLDMASGSSRSARKGIYTDTDKLNPEVGKSGYRVNGTYVDQFAATRSASRLPQLYRRALSVPKSVLGLAGTFGAIRHRRPCEPWNNSTELKRLGLTGTVQAELSRNFTLTVDGFYSDFKDDQINRGVECRCSGLLLRGPTDTTVEDGVVTHGTFTNVPAVRRNNRQFQAQGQPLFAWLATEI